MNGIKKTLWLHLRFWAILLGSIASGICLCVLGYYIACAIKPPVFIDIDGTERAAMPLGQAFIGLVVGIAGGIVVLIFLLRKNRSHFK